MQFFPGSSKRWAFLVFRCRELADRFLPAVPDPLGSYSDMQYDNVRAFIVLVHAEIEDYLETAAHDVLTSAHRQWELDSIPRSPLIAVLAFSKARVEEPPSSKTSGRPAIRQVVKKCVDGFGNDVFNTNHGIKEANILALLLPVGVRESDLPTTWIGAMDSFGATRGSHAHKSASATTLPDPFVTLQAVTDLLDGLLTVDLRLQQHAAE